MLRRCLTLVLALSSLACGRDGTFLVVKVEATGDPSDVRQLLIEVAQSASSALVRVPDPPASTPLSWPVTFSLELAEGANVSLYAEADDRAGAKVAVGEAQARVVPNQVSRMTLRLEGRPTHCRNGTADGGETAPDCGGPCGACPGGHACAAPSDCLSGSCGAGVCEFATGPPRWLPGPEMTVARFGPSAATGSDGLIYLMGGVSLPPLGDLDRVETLDPATGVWKQLPPLSEARYSLAGAALDGRVFAVGGRRNDVLEIATVDAFDIAQGQWQAPPLMMLTPRESPAAVAHEGRVYVFGGRTGNVIIGTAEYYDVKANRWIRENDMPRPRVEFGAVVGSDRRIYLIGDGSGSVDAYSPITSSWAEVAPINPGRKKVAVVSAPDGRLYSIGGDGPVAGMMDTLALVDAYFPPANRWASVTPLSTARALLAAAVAPDGRIFAMGGGSNRDGPVVTNRFKTVEVYGPVLQLSATAGAPGDRVLVSGDNFGANARVRVYFDTQSSGPLVGSGRTDQQGRLPAPILVTIPVAPAGRHALTVVDERSAYPAFAPLLVR